MPTPRQRGDRIARLLEAARNTGRRIVRRGIGPCQIDQCAPQSRVRQRSRQRIVQSPAMRAQLGHHGRRTGAQDVQHAGFDQRLAALEIDLDHTLVRQLAQQRDPLSCIEFAGFRCVCAVGVTVTATQGTAFGHANSYLGRRVQNWIYAVFFVAFGTGANRQLQSRVNCLTRRAIGEAEELRALP